MSTLKDVIGFRHDLFFGGAVQIDWFEKDLEKRDKAASNFVFHGPEYFGVGEEDKHGAKAYSLIDTVSLTSEMIRAVDPSWNNPSPIALAIAGYGAGKSHYGLTLARLFSDPADSVSENILANIEHADSEAGQVIRQTVSNWNRPILVLPINGMNNFDLSEELSRQVLVQLRARDLDTSHVEELWPRFQEAEAFVERNFERWQAEFDKVFGTGAKREAIVTGLREHNETIFQQVNEIYDAAVGRPIRMTGTESASQLISTVCKHYCGEEGPFQSVLILFDEFGRFLEFAIEKPHVAGDAALQQVFEGVQDNSNRCFMLCTIQYELKAYISRVSPEKQDAIKRYVGRYDASKKYYLSSNLETLFAHLIEKKKPEFISDHLFSDESLLEWRSVHSAIEAWAPDTQKDSVWREETLFFQTIVKGCWPLHPMASLFLCRLSDQVQQRSAVTFIADVIQREAERDLEKVGEGWVIPATHLFQDQRGTQDPLLQELVSTEKYAVTGSVAHAYSAVEEKYHHDLTDVERHVLLAILIKDKMGLKVSDRSEFHQTVALLTGFGASRIEGAIEELIREYGVLEWNERFARYEIISEGIPRSKFTKFLEEKVRGISPEKVEALFGLHLRKWAGLPKLQEIDPEFGSFNNIISTEWRFKTYLSNRSRIETDIQDAMGEWENAIEPDRHRGQLIYCYVSADAQIEQVRLNIAKQFETQVEKGGYPIAPIFIILMYDKEEKLRRTLSEYWVLHEGLTEEETRTYRNFIDDQKYRLEDELQLTCDGLVGERRYILPRTFTGEEEHCERVCFSLFQQTYPRIISFPFDGFHTAKGQAVKDCREMTVELFKGALDHEWFSTRTPAMQSRVKAVLQNAWRIFDDAGKIGWYPAHSGLKEIISSFERELKEESGLNLGELFRTLIRPPYGFNIASAGLVLGIFVSPRIESTALMFEGKNISPSAWVSEALSKNFIDIKVLGKTFIKHVDTDEWQMLLANWMAETKHKKCVAFMEEAALLRERIPLPSDVLHERWRNLHEKADKSRRALGEFEDFLEAQGGHLRIALERGKVDNISRVGNTMAERHRKMLAEKNRWHDEQINEVSEGVNRSREAVKALFESWLQDQSCISTERIDSFRHNMLKQVGGNLKSLGCNDLYEKLEKHTHQVIYDMKERQRVFYSVDAAKPLLTGKKIHNQTKIADLSEWITRCEELKSDLDRARKIRDVPEIDKTIQKLDEFQKECKAQRKRQRDRNDELLNRSLETIEDIRKAHIEVRELMTIFAGEDLDLEELSKMEKRLGQFEQDFSLWSDDLSTPTDELRQRVEARIQETLSEEEKDEDLPFWRDAREIYEGFLAHLIAARKARSADWLVNVRKTPEVISEMEADDCYNLLSRLESAPAYLTDEDRAVIGEMKEAIQKRLEGLKIEGLLVLYRQLPQTLRREFYEIISAEV